MVICLWSLIFLEWLRSPRDFQCSISGPNCADFISQFLKYLKYLNISFSFHFLKWNQPQIHWIMELINGRIPLLHLCVKGWVGASVCVGGGGYMHIDSAHYPCLYLPNGVSEHLLAVMSYFAHVYTLFFSDKAWGGGIVLGWCMRREREAEHLEEVLKSKYSNENFPCINTWWMLDMDLDEVQNNTEESKPNRKVSPKYKLVHIHCTSRVKLLSRELMGTQCIFISFYQLAVQFICSYNYI